MPAKLLAVPSGRIANTVSCPMKKSTLLDSDPSPPPTITIGARAIASQMIWSISLGLVDRMRLDQFDPRGDQFVAHLLEHVGALAAHGVDDEDGLLGKGLHTLTLIAVRPDGVEGGSSRTNVSRLRSTPADMGVHDE